MPTTRRHQLPHGITVLATALLLAVSACSGSANGPSRSIDGSVCGEYVAILTEESARFAELVEPGPNNFSPPAIALAESETPRDRTLDDIDRMVVIYDMFIEEFDAASKRLADANAGARNHALSGYATDLEDVFVTLIEIYTQFRDQLQEDVSTTPERVLEVGYFIGEGNVASPVFDALLSPEPLASFRTFNRYLAGNCPALQTILADAWRNQPPGTLYRHWDTKSLVTTTAQPIP